MERGEGFFLSFGLASPMEIPFSPSPHLCSRVRSIVCGGKGNRVSLQVNSPVSVWNPPILPLSRTGRDGFFMYEDR